MARITVEDCLERIDNRFDLILLATKRARQLANGAEATVPWNNDKPTVVALREIAAGTIDPSLLEEGAGRETGDGVVSGESLEEQLQEELQKAEAGQAASPVPSQEAPGFSGDAS